MHIFHFPTIILQNKLDYLKNCILVNMFPKFDRYILRSPLWLSYKDFSKIILSDNNIEYKYFQKEVSSLESIFSIFLNSDFWAVHSCAWDKLQNIHNIEIFHKTFKFFSIYGILSEFHNPRKHRKPQLVLRKILNSWIFVSMLKTNFLKPGVQLKRWVIGW